MDYSKIITIEPGKDRRMHNCCSLTLRVGRIRLDSESQATSMDSYLCADPKRSGKPCIRGMRITAVDVLEYLAGGMTPEEIIEDFPELTLEDIRACFAFAADRERRLMTASLR